MYAAPSAIATGLPRCTLAPLRSARVGQQRISGSLLPSLDPYPPKADIRYTQTLCDILLGFHFLFFNDEIIKIIQIKG